MPVTPAFWNKAGQGLLLNGASQTLSFAEETGLKQREHEGADTPRNKQEHSFESKHRAGISLC